ncbi:MAG: tetratricopeptide repeat protein [Promethearchaeota archaeon]|jgi:tetratricopeptide (TPR) repeat protein
MPNSIRQAIERGWELLNEGKEEDAFQAINKFENKENITQDERLRCEILKTFLQFFSGQFEETLLSVEKVYQECLEFKKPLLTIDIIFIKWLALIQLGDDEESREGVVYIERLLKSPLQETHPNIKQREAFLNFMKGHFFDRDGALDSAIDAFKKSLSICELDSRLNFLIPRVLMRMGGAYYFKGELKKALKVHKKSLEYSKGNSIGIKIIKNWNFNFIGRIYFQQGELDLAIEYFEKSMKIIEQDYLIQGGCRVYDNMIRVLLDKNDKILTKEYLDRSQQYKKKVESEVNRKFFKLSEARILKASTRTRDRAQAEIILKALINVNTTEESRFWMGGFPHMISLCELYFEELKLTNDIAILEDIQPIVERLIEEAKLRNSYSLQAQAYLLQGKVSLLRMNLGDARLFLTKAQQIAEPHGLQLLAHQISSEHDKLLEQFDEWEDLKKRKATISERIDLASLEDTIDRMQEKKQIDIPELINEDPLVLLILAEGGVMMFSYPFTEEWKSNNDIFGNFLSAFTTFSNEFFSRELDRAKFGEFTVLMKSISKFLVCYVFKGQSYQAQQKLTKFTEQLNENAPVRQTLDTFYNSGQVIETKNFPFLEVFIKEIFLR